MKRAEKNAIIFTALFVIVVVIGFVVIGNVSGMITENDINCEQEHLYWKNVPCEVTEIQNGLVFSMHVRNDAYDIERTFRLWGGDAEEFRDVEVGSIIWCTMYSWVVEGTGEVVSRALELINE